MTSLVQYRLELVFGDTGGAHAQILCRHVLRVHVREISLYKIPCCRIQYRSGDGLGEAGDGRSKLLYRLDQVGGETGVVHGEEAVRGGGHEVGEDGLYLLGDEAGVGRCARGFRVPVVGDGAENFYGGEDRGSGERERGDVLLESAVRGADESGGGGVDVAGAGGVLEVGDIPYRCGTAHREKHIGRGRPDVDVPPIRHDKTRPGRRTDHERWGCAICRRWIHRQLRPWR